MGAAGTRRLSGESALGKVVEASTTRPTRPAGAEVSRASSQVAALDAHAAICPACAQVASRYQTLLKALRMWDLVPIASPEFVDRLRNLPTDRPDVIPFSRPHLIPRLAWLSAAAAVFVAVVIGWRIGRVADKPGIDLLILDGEAAPAGGMGVCRQLKDEIFNCPPILVLIARPQDAWLAHWSKADTVVVAPVDPFELAHASCYLIRLDLESVGRAHSG